MKKLTTLCCTATAAALAIGFANAEIMPISDLVKKTKREIPAGFTQMTPDGKKAVTPSRSNSPKKELTNSQTSTILFEDFSNVPKGEFVQTGNIGLRAVTSIANYDCGNFMNPAYTPNSGQWYGSWVFAGEEGSAIIQTYNPMSQGYLQFPLGDYSGDLIVTMRIRPRLTFWGADNEVGYVTSAAGASCDLLMTAVTGGYGSFNPANSELSQGTQVAKLYERDGWTEVRTTFRNLSANGDGSLMIFTGSACEIDWIKVEDANTYLAAPVGCTLTDFQENEFSIKWDQVRRAYNYYIDFFYAKWLADKGVDDNYDFESGIPAGFTAGGATAAAGEGLGDSNGVRIADGEDNALVTPTYVAPLEECGVKFIFRQTMSDEEFAELTDLPTLCIDGLTEEGWRPAAEAVIDGFWTGGNYFYGQTLKGEQFANQYKALRFYSKNTDDENYFVIDDITPWAPRPYELARVVDPDPEHDHSQSDFEDYREYIEQGIMTEEEVWEALNSPFNRWWNTEANDPCEYTFKDCVEPDKEYFYRIRSHRLEINGNGNTFVGDEVHHALGVAAPQMTDAIDVNANGYTATWKDAAKAQNYIVTNYVANEIAEDTPDYPVFDETFENVSGPTDLNSFEPVTADKLDTDMPGWDGEELIKGQNAVGCQYGGILISPEIGVVEKGNKPYYVYFEAVTDLPAETLVVQFNGLQTYVLVSFEEDGTVAGTITVNQPVQGESISFYTYNGYPFAIKALEVTQDVEKGSIVREFESHQVVPAGVQKAVFSGLDKEHKYAYKVVSVFDFEKQQVRSMANGLYSIVDLNNGSTTQWSKVEEIDGEAEVVARYTIDGLEAPANYKGMVIERLSNGKTRKVMKF